MSVFLDDSMHEQIQRRSQTAADVDKMTPKERENFFRKNRERLAELEKWFAEHPDTTGVDWDAPSEGMYAVGETIFAEDEYDPSISPEAEEALIAESEENNIDSGYLTKEELKNVFDLDDEESAALIARSREGDKISMELFGVTGTENMSRAQTNKVRKKLGLSEAWW